LADAGATLTIAATEEGFRVDGLKRGPGIVRLGRYRIRLSHQNAPAIVILDPDAARPALAPQWYPYDPGYRFILALEADAQKIALGSTRTQGRAAERVGWFSFTVDGRDCRVAGTGLLEPGVPADLVQIFVWGEASGRRADGVG